MSLIIAKNLHKSFGSEKLIVPVLHDINMRVEQDEFLGIMGKSGAGKSTLLYLLSLLDHPTKGTITVNGTDVNSLTETERTAFRLHTLGYVFQDYALVPDLTATENVLLPVLMRGEKYKEAINKSVRSLNEVGLHNKNDSLPSEMSGGEQQRVAIARAIADKPSILFADEPTANLDSQSGQNIIDLLTCLNKEHKLTVVMVTHEREYATNCNRILHMEDGRIVNEEFN